VLLVDHGGAPGVAAEHSAGRPVGGRPHPEGPDGIVLTGIPARSFEAAGWRAVTDISIEPGDTVHFEVAGQRLVSRLWPSPKKATAAATGSGAVASDS